MASDAGAAQPNTTDTVVSLLNSLPPETIKFVEATILTVCLVMILGGLLVFYLRSGGEPWKAEYVQVLGTIFFFPTLIILAVYLNMSRDAVVGILGAFLGSLFTRNINPGRNGGASNTPGNEPKTEPEPRQPLSPNQGDQTPKPQESQKVAAES